MRRRAGPGLVAAAASLVLLGSGCVAPGPEPSRSAAVAPSAEAPATPGAPSLLPATTPPSPPPSAIADATPLVDPAPLDLPNPRFLVVCENWGAEPPSDDVDCNFAIELALSALGGEAASQAARLDVRYGQPCVIDASCERRADARTVVAIAASFETLVVRVGRDESGDIRVWPPVAGRRVPPPAFAAPPPRAPNLGDGAPAAVRGREPFPFCGKEILATPDGYDTAARRCFLRGVEAWTPVELISVETTDTGVVTRLYRFDGRGPIAQFVRTPSGWASVACGISPIRTIAVFVMSQCGKTETL